MSHLDILAFDLDGTLVDTAPDLTAALNHALQCLGREPVAPGSVRAMVGHGARALLERGLAATGAMDPESVEAGLPHFMDHYRANIARKSRPFPGAEAVLDWAAAAGVRLAICTNKPEGLARDLVRELGWGERFHAILGADSRPWRKPDPRHLLDTIAAAGGGRTLFVGDSRTDADTAAAAAIPFVLVSFGYAGDELASLKADHRIDHFDALPPILAAVQTGFSGADHDARS
jgi:phosphoglycolate phosphatase